MTFAYSPVVVFAGAGYEELEFWYAVLRCREAGAEVVVLGLDGPEVCSGRCSYPVVPDRAVGDYDGVPSLVVVPGFDGYSFEELGKRTTESLRAWWEAGATLAATSTGVAALALAQVVNGGVVSCPPSVADLVEKAGGSVSIEPCTVSGKLVTARSVDYISDLFRALTDSSALGVNN